MTGEVAARMSDRPLITLLSPDLAANLMIRAYELIEVLRGDFRIQIVGRGRPGELWPPLSPLSQGLGIECKSFDLTAVEVARRARSLVRELIDGDVVVALGLLPGSHGLGLVARSTLRRPLVLDNHEWEPPYLPPIEPRPVSELPSALLYRATHRLIDLTYRRADAMLVTNTFLSRRYGGYWLPHVRNEETFAPRPERPHPVNGKLTVMFLGTARSYKGLSDLLRAWAAVEAPGARLRIVGPIKSNLRKELKAQADDRVSFESPIALDQVPSTLEEADLVVIPQREHQKTIGQLPSKLVEAMAMGRAIVSTAVGDAPLWLAGGAGVIVPPQDPAALAQAISSLLASRDRRLELGRRARERFLELGSVRAHRERVVDLFQRLIERRELPRVWPSIADLSGVSG